MIYGKRSSDDLDLIRGLSAVAVLVYHIRYRFFFDYSDIITPDFFTFSFYALTSFGHDAVIVFFVLSGFFISASVLRDQAAERWSWKRYAINRLTRLYLVLLPGLLLTILWDLLGLCFYPGNPIYSGVPRPWGHDFFPVSDRLSLSTFVANALFLQEILAHPLGSNAPLWSLSYEFWYYVLFPIGWFALVRPTRIWRSIVHLTVFALLLIIVGKNIVVYFPIWLLGTVVCLLPQVPFLKRRQSFLVTYTAIGLFCGIVAATHTGALKGLLTNSVVAVDYLTAVSFASLLYFLLHNQSPGGHRGYAKISKSLASFSFTLYVVHMPLIVFLRAFLVSDTPWSPDLVHVCFGMAIVLGCLFYAWVICRLTESKTELVRDVVIKRRRP